MITICGSIAFYDEMLTAAEELKRMGLATLLPPTEIRGEDGALIDVREYYVVRKQPQVPAWVWERKAEAIRTHFEKIKASEAILVLNFDKNNIAGYIGGNTLLEMGLAFYLNKPIYILKPVPEMAYSEEILGMKPIVLESDLARRPALLNMKRHETV